MNSRILAALVLLPFPVFATTSAHIVIDAEQAPATAKAAFSGSVTQDFKIGAHEIAMTAQLALHLIQGAPERLRMGLAGEGEITEVSGPRLRAWSVVHDGARRLLQLDFSPPTPGDRPEFACTIRSRRVCPLPSQSDALVLTPGDAADWTWQAAVHAGSGLHVDTAATGAVSGPPGRYFANGEASLHFSVNPSVLDVSFSDARLEGNYDPSTGIFRMRLAATAEAAHPGARTAILGGGAAPARVPDAVGWHLEVAQSGQAANYEWVAERGGRIPVELAFVARKAGFSVPTGGIVQYHIATGESRTVWEGFLSANGRFAVPVVAAAPRANSDLVFRSSEETRLEASAGMLRATTNISFHVIQGALTQVRILLAGVGDVLDVRGMGIEGWKVQTEAGVRMLTGALAQPVVDGGKLEVRTQTPISFLPARIEPLRMTPAGALQHSGEVSLHGTGGIQPDLADARGMVQLSNDRSPRFRFYTAERSYALSLTPLAPEVDVSEIATYRLMPSGRTIDCEVELSIRKAPTTEWSFGIPAEYAVEEISGPDLGDNAVANDALGAVRNVTLTFTRSLIGRTLVHLRLAQAGAEAAAPWRLPALQFPRAASVRGQIAVTAATGYRLDPTALAGLEEIAASVFPRQDQVLSHAYRVTDRQWSATILIQPLPRLIQADLFHLYAVKPHGVAADVLVNFAVSGAPATEWKIAIPADAANLRVTGEGVRNDWQREGGVLTIPIEHPALGVSTLLISFDENSAAASAPLALGEVHPLGVESERGYVAVTGTSQDGLGQVKLAGAVFGMAADDLPPEYRVLASAAPLAVFEYPARPFRIEAALQRAASAAAVEQVVELAGLQTRISPAGEGVTELELEVKRSAGQWLRAEIPAGTELWECRVEGAPTIPRRDGATVLIPLSSVSEGSDPLRVDLRLGQRSVRKGWQVTVLGPRLFVPLVLADWRVETVAAGSIEPVDGAAFRTRPQGSADPLLLLALLILIGSAAAASRAGSAGWLPTAAVAGVLVVVLVVKLWLERSAEAASLGHEALYTAQALPAGTLLQAQALMVPGWIRALRQIGIPVAALLLLGVAWLPLPRRLLAAWRQWKLPRGAARPAAASLLIVFGALTLPARAQEPAAFASIVQTWRISGEKLQAQVDFSLRATAGEQIRFLGPPAVLTGFSGDGISMSAGTGNDAGTYWVSAQRTGLLRGRASYEQVGVDWGRGVPVLTAAAGVQRISVAMDRPGLVFISSGAVTVDGLALVIGGAGERLVRAVPRPRDREHEPLRFTAELATLAMPRPGIVSLATRVTLRPITGILRSAQVKMPPDIVVTDVEGSGVARWKASGRGQIVVDFFAGEAEPLSFLVRAEQSAPDLPYPFRLGGASVDRAERQFSLLAIASGSGVRLEGLAGEAVEPVGAGDPSLQGLLVQMRERASALTAYRCLRPGARLGAKVVAVTPDVRAETQTEIQIGDDRMVLTADVRLSIRRVGLFDASFVLPERLEVESLSGDHVSHWLQHREGGGRVVTVHFLRQILGEAAFSVTLAGPVPGPSVPWTVPRLKVIEAGHQQGTVQLTAGTGMGTRVIRRLWVAELPGEPGESGAVSESQPLRFRLLGPQAELVVALEPRPPWVTAQYLEEITEHENRRERRIAIRYHVENAAIRSAFIQIPDLTAEEAATVTANGPAVNDFVRALPRPDRWEIRFQKKILGDTSVEIRSERAVPAGLESRRVAPAVLDDAGEVVAFVALRAAGRSEIEGEDLPSAWERADWRAAPRGLRPDDAAGSPEGFFRLADGAGPMRYRVTRHAPAATKAVRVLRARLLTALSGAGNALHAIDLELSASGKTPLRFNLPAGAQIFGVTVNGEPVSVVWDGNFQRIMVAPAGSSPGSARARIVYEQDGLNGFRPTLAAPRLEVAWENVSWAVSLPLGRELASWASPSLQFVEESPANTGNLEEYRQRVAAARDRARAGIMADFTRAGALAQAGRQDEAEELLRKLANFPSLDGASSEDARVQLRAVRTQQATLAVNARVQRLYLSRTPGSERDPELALAASVDPLLSGSSNFDPQQLGEMTRGNSEARNAALQAIASRIVEHQMASEIQPQSLDLAVPTAGRTEHFNGAVQMGGGEPLELVLKLR